MGRGNLGIKWQLGYHHGRSCVCWAMIDISKFEFGVLNITVS